MLFLKTRNRKRSALLTFGVVLIGLFLACVVWIRKEQRQYALNRQLIAALKRNDIRQAITLVEVGADPNTRSDPTPAPSLSQCIKHLLHRSPLPVNDSPTALMLACGDHSHNLKLHGLCIDSGDPQLTQAMLLHGANVNAKAANGRTALHVAVMFCPNSVIRQLLIHGADANSISKSGVTVITIAGFRKRADIVALLRRYNKRP